MYTNFLVACWLGGYNVLLLLNYMNLEDTLRDVVHNHNVSHIVAFVQPGTAHATAALRSSLPELQSVVALPTVREADSRRTPSYIGDAVRFDVWLRGPTSTFSPFRFRVTNSSAVSGKHEAASDSSDITNVGAYQLIARTNSFGCTELVVYKLKSIVQWYLQRSFAGDGGSFSKNMTDEQNDGPWLPITDACVVLQRGR